MANISKCNEYSRDFLETVINTVNLGPTQKTVIFMLSRGFSQSEITKKLGVSRQSVSHSKKVAIDRYNSVIEGKKMRDINSKEYGLKTNFTFEEIKEWADDLERKEKRVS